MVRKGNWLVIMCLGAALYGLALIWSATRYDPDLHSLPGKQLIALGAGVVLCLLLRALPVRGLVERGWWLLAAGNVGLLLLLIPFGNDDGTGNKSWLALPGGVFNLQPGEFVKVGFLLLLALQLTRREKKGLNRSTSILLLAAHGLGLCGLVWAVSGDLGMVTVYLGIYFVMLWGAGVHPLWILGELAAGVGAVAFLWPRLPEYVRMRFLVVWDHDLDPLGKGFQQERSLLAVGSGQVTGQGYLQGTQTQSEAASSLPARHTDFIFSVAGEELGLVGCLTILVLLFAIGAGCLVLGQKGDRLLALTAQGVAGMLGIQTILNVGMCLYVAPVIGVTLPFFSYGGSSMLASFGAVGVLLSLAKERKKLTG
ncbi:MAG: FtsW/RodA/SpoVE family cell cycle protein [Ruminiclostridium sp.]|nr:FtsW/RodA/SpoVE family cell cycle protein [Ruminiclostridium sp.]